MNRFLNHTAFLFDKDLRSHMAKKGLRISCEFIEPLKSAFNLIVSPKNWTNKQAWINATGPVRVIDVQGHVVGPWDSVLTKEIKNFYSNNPP